MRRDKSRNVPSARKIAVLPRRLVLPSGYEELSLAEAMLCPRIWTCPVCYWKVIPVRVGHPFPIFIENSGCVLKGSYYCYSVWCKICEEATAIPFFGTVSEAVAIWNAKAKLLAGQNNRHAQDLSLFKNKIHPPTHPQCSCNIKHGSLSNYDALVNYYNYKRRVCKVWYELASCPKCHHAVLIRSKGLRRGRRVRYVKCANCPAMRGPNAASVGEAALLWNAKVKLLGR